MEQEKPECELKRLRMVQNKLRRDEVFGGFSLAERIEYEARSERIHALESQIRAGLVAERNARSAKAKQKFQWNKDSDTDTFQPDVP